MKHRVNMLDRGAMATLTLHTEVEACTFLHRTYALAHTLSWHPPVAALLCSATRDKLGSLGKL